jgi:hypothetical protein
MSDPQYVQSTMDPGSWNIYNQVKVSDDMEEIKLDPYDSFCSVGKSSNKLTDKCNNLTEYNCNQVGCCVFTSNKKCVPGDAAGATPTAAGGTPVAIDYYYYLNKCYGTKCPK